MVYWFNGDNEESDHPPRIYKETGSYIWCNRRECILVLNGEADNSQFVMTEDDHRFISERLPALIGTLRSDNGNGNGNVRSLGRAGPHRVGVPTKIEITNFTSENVDDGH